MYPSVTQKNFRGLLFCIGKDGPKLFEKTIDRLALYASMQFNNGSDVVACIQSEEYIGPEEPIMPKNPTHNDKCIWDYKMNDLLKTEHN